MDHPRGRYNLLYMPLKRCYRSHLSFTWITPGVLQTYSTLKKPTLYTLIKVLPFAFVFHMDHPRGDWLKSDVEWSNRGPSTLDRFFLDVHTRYATSQNTSIKGMADDVHIVPVATELGQSCTAACENVGLGCRGMNAGRLKPTLFTLEIYFIYRRTLLHRGCWAGLLGQ